MSSTSSEESEESKCPVNYPGKNSAKKGTSATPSSPLLPSSPLPPSPLTGGCPVKHSSETASATTEATATVDRSSEGYGASINDMVFGQDRQKDQKANLSTTRMLSTIPKNDFTPDHQPKDGTDKWMYPSEQQYYNALKRKGYSVTEETMPALLAIHNSVNEQSMSMVRQWELLRGNTNPKLTRFMGRPKDVSPKAYFNHFFLGYILPFDRHDWYIDRDGKQVRYIIDFYAGSKNESISRGMPAGVHLDVRPALDSGTAIFDRVSHFLYSNFMPWRMPLKPESADSSNKNNISSRNSSNNSSSTSS